MKNVDRQTNRPWRRHRAAAGYTLMEMAIVMAVVGIMLAAFTGAYNIYAREKARSVTIAHAEEIMKAIDRYVMQNGHYPCPSPMTVAFSHANYGMETDCSDTTSVGVGAINTTHGYAVEESGVDTVIDPEEGATPVRPRVRRGAVPFRVLGLAEKHAYDGYGMRFMYAVTENLAVPGRFMAGAGGVGVYRGAAVTTAASVVRPEYSAHFVLFSAGPNRMGAYNRHGVRPFACATGTIDWQNCNTSTSAANRLSRYAIAPYSTAAGANYYDDYMRFYTATELPIWRTAGGGAYAGLDVRDSLNAEFGGGLGIGDKMPAQQLSVRGSVRVSGQLHVNRICKEDGRECFNVPINPGTEWDCSAGEYLIGFEGGRARCSASVEVRCPPGEYVRGINSATGELVCGEVRGCPRKAVDVCFNEATGIWERDTLASVSNGSDSTASGGLSRVDTYTCVNGEWLLDSSSGQCSCKNVLPHEQRFYSCDRGYYLDDSIWPEPGGRYTGSIEVNYSRSCPNDPVENVFSHTCRCDDSVPTKETRVTMCPNGSENRIVEERTWSCPSATSTFGTWSAWTAVTPPTVCNACTPRTEEELVACPVGYTSTNPDIPIRRQRNLSGTCIWGAWSVAEDNCTVCSGALQVRNIGCDNSAGSRLQTRTFNCGTDVFDAWTTLHTSCVAAPTLLWRANDTTSRKVTFGTPPARLLGTAEAGIDTGTKSVCYRSAGGFEYWELQCVYE